MKHLSLAASLALALVSASSAQVTPCLSAFDNPNYLAGTTMGGPNLLLGIKLTNGPLPILAFGGEVFTGNRTGPNTLGIWSHDVATDQPGSMLVTGSWNSAGPLGWEGASFIGGPTQIAANQTFWLVWGPQNGAQISAEANNRTTGQPYRGSFDNGQSWNGPFISYDWKFRIWCSPLASFTTFGSGCAGSNGRVPAMGASGAPQIGTNFALQLSSALPNTTAYAFLGMSNGLWAGAFNLPFDLGPYGAPTCMILVDLLAEAAMPTDGLGAASLQLGVPNLAAMAGVSLYAQWLVVDPTANALQIVTSDGGFMVLGI